ncbi:MAG: 16S rRNA (uracil(1498)-N(3))-methyltransferase [Selenomonadaceae bacterium]|nr:16S rRNA (uracil(1498)-N(3))-methyltransferase [Selenomonadaceae bacterium]
MKRIFLEEAITENVKITGKDANHLAHSLRAQKGDQIIAVDKFGNTAVIEFTAFEGNIIYARTVGEIKSVAHSETIKILRTIGKAGELETHMRSSETFVKRITLADCLPKQNKFDTIVEKATELGIDRLEPLISDRTIARPGNFRAKSKLERWARVAKEAAEQCARDTLPEIGSICELADWLKEIKPRLGKFKDKKFDGGGALLLFFNEKETADNLPEILHAYKNCDCDKNIILLIGPEGGFSEREVREIKAAGGVSVSLGRRILKTDTAAISALAIVQYEMS